MSHHDVDLGARVSRVGGVVWSWPSRLAPAWVGAGAVAVMLAVLAAMLGQTAAAGAYAQRGHAFAFSFGSEGEGAGQFGFGGAFKRDEPPGVAVNEASGDVYVVDRGNDRVEQFAPQLGGGGELVGEQFVAAWGWGVSDGKAEYEVCTSACRAGIAGVGRGQLKEPGSVAVDNSAGGGGTVYVGAAPAAKKPDVQRYTADGVEALGKLPMEEEGQLDGVAVDAYGTAWIYRGEAEELAVIEGFTGTKHPVRLEPTITSPLACPKPGFAVDAGGENFAVDRELPNGELECPAALELEAPAEGGNRRPTVAGEFNGAEALAGGEASISELDREGTTALAVDQASGAGTPLGAAAKGDVYVDNGTSIAAFSSSGTLIQRFGGGDLKAGAGVAIDARTGDVFVVDADAESVQLFAPEPAAKPAVEALEAHDLSPSEVRLAARVNARGEDTHYFFQYGTVECASDPAGCTDVPAAPGTDIGAGFEGHDVGVKLEGLTAGTTYFYRVVAANSFGQAEGAQTQATFDTLPSSAGLLADGRAWELVSPAEKDGASIEPLSREGGLIQAAGGGEAVTYVASGPVVGEPQGNRSPEPTQTLSVRSSAGWSTQDVMTPHTRAEGLETGEPAAFRFFSEDLALSLVQPPGGNVEPLEAPPLAPGASEHTIYVRADAPIGPSPAERTAYGEAEANSAFLAPGYAPLVTPADVTAEPKPGEKGRFGGRLNFLDATPDLHAGVFESEVPLLAGSAPGLYEWQAGGGLKLVSVLPDGAGAGEPALGNEGSDVRGAISQDGTRVFFTGESESGAQTGLYMRDTQTGQTIQVNAAQGVVEPTGEESEVTFQAATPDGSRVFFTETAPLTAESTQRQGREADLYECELTEREGNLGCSLKDLTPLPTGGSADVLNMVAGVSEDGSTEYFVANAALAPGASEGHCTHQAGETPQPGATCNLYLAHDGHVTFIATLSNEDSGDWGSLHGSGRVSGFAANRADLADLTARVSPDGRYLAFMSQEPLTGYDNTDANAPGVRDEEVFLYDASTRLLSCVSCNAGGPSVGVHDVEHSGEGIGLLVDRRGDWSDEYLAGSVPGWTPLGLDGAVHQPRYLSESGRLFFDSPDQLVPQAVNGKEDVYEFEPDGVGSCARREGCLSLISSGSAGQESAFVEASEDGSNAFFVTAQPLVAADHDTNYDLYDARVCTAASPCLTSEESSLRPCESSRSCQPEMTPPPSFAAPPSETNTGEGNRAKSQALGDGQSAGKPTGKPKAPTRKQLLAKALRACRKQKSKHKRAVCERQTRKRYAPKSSARRSAHGADRRRK